MINYPDQNKDNDLFSDIIITDIDSESTESYETSSIDPGLNLSDNRKSKFYRYLALYKVEQRKEKMRLRKLLEFY
jgi:hypothetical protein